MTIYEMGSNGISDDAYKIKRTKEDIKEEIIEGTPELYKAAMKNYLEDQAWDEENQAYRLPKENELFKY